MTSDLPDISQIHEEVMKQKAGPQENRGSRGTDAPGMTCLSGLPTEDDVTPICLTGDVDLDHVAEVVPSKFPPHKITFSPLYLINI